MQKKRFSIIPDAEQKNILSVLSFEGKSDRYKEIFWFAASLVVVGIIYLTFFLIGQQINSKTQDLTQQKADLDMLVRNDEQRKELESFVQRINSLQTIIVETKYPSEFLPIFTGELSRYVTLTDFSLDVENATIFLAAQADSPETVESQFEFWRQHTEFIESVEKSQLPSSDDADEAVFRATLKVNPEFLQFTASPHLSLPVEEPEPEEEENV